MADILDKAYSTRAKDRLTGELIHVLRSDLGDGYVYDIETHKIYHQEELEFGTPNPMLFSYRDAHRSEISDDVWCTGLPF